MPPPRFVARWLFGFPGYLWPWPTLFFGLSFVSLHAVESERHKFASIEVGWLTSLFMWNLTMLAAVAGAWHLFFYVRKRQGLRHKYCNRWLSEHNPIFLFRDQVKDNIFRNLFAAVPVWTAYEALTLYLQARGLVPTVDIHRHPVYCAVLILATPLLVVAHFYFTHRLLHWSPLYRTVHYIHHKNSNPGPRSGLAMHPAEHVMLFSAVMIFWIIPSAPVNAVYLLALTALSAPEGHLGFGALEFGAGRSLPVSDHLHYLHHRYVAVNFGSPLLPLDRWFGTLLDGSDDAATALRGKDRTPPLG